MFYINLRKYFLLIHYAIFNQGYNSVMSLLGRNVRLSHENEFPGVASIIHLINIPGIAIENKHKCTATFISRQDVLTADHCLRDTFTEGFKILVGSTDLAFAIEFYPMFSLSYEYWVRYRQRQPDNYMHDITIIKIIGNVHEGIEFSPTGNVDSELLYGLDAQIPGWGRLTDNSKPRKLRAGEVRILSKRECQKRYFILTGRNDTIDAKALCTIGNPVVVLHHGDSGGPLIFFGTVVAVNHGVCPGTPDNSIHTYQINLHLNIRYYQEFIEDQIDQEYNFVMGLLGPNIRLPHENEFPGVVSVLAIVTSDTLPIEQKHICTATLISRQDVLTADHCFSDTFTEGFKVLVGSTDLFQATEVYPMFILSYEYWVRYRQRQPDNLIHDITIIKIIGNVPEGIELSPTGNVNSELLYGLDAKIPGWGRLTDYSRPRNLRAGEVRILSKQECQDRFFIFSGLNGSMDEKTLCTIGNPVVVLHHGDSGGPLIFNGSVIAINHGVCPRTPSNSIRSYQINLHSNIHYYQEFIQDLTVIFHMNF